MHDLFVVTHPHAEHTARDIVGGWHDSHLTPSGIADARRIAEELECRRRNPRVPLRITTSDLLRCTETARIVADTLDVPVTEDRRLREISYGEAEGRPNAWLAERRVLPPDDDRLDHRGPISGAETRREVATRVGECVTELMHDDEHDHVVVTHGFAQTSVVTAWLRIPVQATGFVAFSTVPGAITHLRLVDFSGSRTVVALADTAHLQNRHDSEP